MCIVTKNNDLPDHASPKSLFCTIQDIPNTILYSPPVVGSLPDPAMLQLPTINHLAEHLIPQPMPLSQEPQPVAICKGLPHLQKIGQENNIKAIH